MSNANLKRLLSLVLLWSSCNIAYAQIEFKCDLENFNLKICKDASTVAMAKKNAEIIYANSHGSLIFNVEAFKLCNNIQSILAVTKGGQRLIYYPSKYLKSSEPDWVERGLLFHAIAHLQIDHADTSKHYQNELAADERAVQLLLSSDAKPTFKQAKLFIEHSRTLKGTSRMPSVEARLQAIDAAFPAPKAKISPITSTFIEPATVTFQNTSINTPNGTTFIWFLDDQSLQPTNYKAPLPPRVLSAGSHSVRLLVIDPYGRRDSTYHPFEVRERPGFHGNGNRPIDPTPNKLKWGFQAGAVYTPYYYTFSPSAGFVMSYHPDKVGIQIELNYVRNNDEGYSEGTAYNNQGVPVGDIERDHYFNIHNLELPIIAIWGGNKTPKATFNLLAGLKLRCGVWGNQFISATTYYDNGLSRDNYEYSTVDFDYDYPRFRYGALLGLSYGSDNFSIGSRLEVDSYLYGQWYPSARAYIMMKFPKTKNMR